MWSVDPNDASYPQRPGADLDLYWLDNQGNEITNSESGDNNFEVVGVYDVRPAGTRTLRTRAYRLPPSPVRMACGALVGRLTGPHMEQEQRR